MIDSIKKILLFFFACTEEKNKFQIAKSKKRVEVICVSE